MAILTRECGQSVVDRSLTKIVKSRQICVLGILQLRPRSGKNNLHVFDISLPDFIFNLCFQSRLLPQYNKRKQLLKTCSISRNLHKYFGKEQ